MSAGNHRTTNVRMPDEAEREGLGGFVDKLLGVLYKYQEVLALGFIAGTAILGYRFGAFDFGDDEYSAYETGDEPELAAAMDGDREPAAAAADDEPAADGEERAAPPAADDEEPDEEQADDAPAPEEPGKEPAAREAYAAADEPAAEEEEPADDEHAAAEEEEPATEEEEPAARPEELVAVIDPRPMGATTEAAEPADEGEPARIRPLATAEEAERRFLRREELEAREALELRQFRLASLKAAGIPLPTPEAAPPGARSGSEDDAPAEADDAPAVDGGDPDISRRLSRAERYLKSDRVQRALTTYEAAVRLAPSSVRARVGYAEALIAVERDKDAELQLAVALEHEPDNGDALVMMGEIAERRGDRATARELYEKFVETNPKSRKLRAVKRRLKKLQ